VQHINTGLQAIGLAFAGEVCNALHESLSEYGNNVFGFQPESLFPLGATLAEITGKSITQDKLNALLLKRSPFDFVTVFEYIGALFGMHPQLMVMQPDQRTATNLFPVPGISREAIAPEQHRAVLLNYLLDPVAITPKGDQDIWGGLVFDPFYHFYPAPINTRAVGSRPDAMPYLIKTFQDPANILVSFGVFNPGSGRPHT
jgi:hypothetical protein